MYGILRARAARQVCRSRDTVIRVIVHGRWPIQPSHRETERRGPSHKQVTSSAGHGSVPRHLARELSEASVFSGAEPLQHRAAVEARQHTVDLAGSGSGSGSRLSE
eukprot:COSAG02_NODE_29501_length_568_cov_0.660981_1_plen_105_part_10